MISLVIALYCLAAPAAFLVLVIAAGLVGRRLSGGEFSLWRYAAWLAFALVLAVPLVGARTGGMFFPFAIALVFWVLCRAAADAQATTIREKVGFVQLYAGLCLVEYLALERVAVLDAAEVSPWFRYALHDDVGHLVLPALSLFGTTDGASGSVVFSVVEGIADGWPFAAALGTLGISAFVYAHFAEHSTPKVGVSLLPVPTPMAVLFAGATLVTLAGPKTPGVGPAATLLMVFLMPFFTAEGLWVGKRLARPLHTKNAAIALLGGLALVLPALAVALAVVGWAFHLVRLRAFEPILGDVMRSANRPRLRSAVLVCTGCGLFAALLGLTESRVARAISPALEDAPSMCADVTVAESPSGVVISRQSLRFTIDSDETRARVSTVETLHEACGKKGARVCTSDEWALACLCSFPNESQGGPKLFTNSRLIYRRESERSGKRGPAAADVRGLLSGATELVLPTAPFAGVLLAGPTDAVADDWRADCRYRGMLTRRAVDEGRFPFVGVRCCR